MEKFFSVLSFLGLFVLVSVFFSFSQVFLIVGLLFIVFFLVSEFNTVKFSLNNSSSLSVYECSYNEMSFFSNFYTFQFFTVAISFMFFDLEVLFFLPLPFIFHLTPFSYFLSGVFLFLLLLGLLWEIMYVFNY